jgi:cell division protein FtsI/penicillin-binding protein 2
MSFRVGRQDVLFVALAGVMIFLGVRLVRMVQAAQIPPDALHADIAQRVVRESQGTTIVLPLPAKPGNIYMRGRKSHILAAGSRQVPSCFVDPSLLDESQLADISGRLCQLLEIDPAETYDDLLARRAEGRRFAWVAREISQEQAQAIRELDNRAVGIEYEWRREYPLGNLAGPVLGFNNDEDAPGGGIHSALARAIQAQSGKRIVRGDAGRRPIWGEGELSERPTDGCNVYTSIDVNIQQVLEQSLAEAAEAAGAKWATGVVINPWTGDVLAMASVPTFDPNHFGDTPPEHMLNRAIATPYEPGSALKPIFAAAAVERGLLSYQSKLDGEDGTYYAHRGGRITDHGSRYGMITLWRALVKSSNIVMSKVGEILGNERLYEIAHEWGFGDRTAIGLPGESPGIIRDLEDWDGYSMRRVPFGQEISVTALQMAMAYGAIANGGVLMKPRLALRITDPQGRELWASQPMAVRRVLSPAVAAETLDVLADVVEEGTGKNARMDRWVAWGKTGTAQIAGQGGYVDGAYTGTWVGGAPKSRPAAVCLISIYWPDRHKKYYGGIVAAPYVKDVLEKTLTYLHVMPDRP